MYAESGEKSWELELSIYGDTRRVDGWRGQCPFRYPGQYEDAETGLYYNRFRYFDPEVGGYLSQDPIGLRGGLRGMAYVKDPTYFTDPTGLASCGATELAQKRADELRNKLSKRKQPRATSAVVDKKTGKVYFGDSGARPDVISPDLKAKIPSESFEDWPVNNCAEFDAVNKAMLDGADINDLEVATVKVKTGEPFPRCQNCLATTEGADVVTDQ